MVANIGYSDIIARHFGFRSMLILWLLSLSISQNLQAQDNLTIRVRPFMGTTFSLIIQGQESDQNTQVADQAFAEIERIEKIFSTYIPDSEVSQVNATSRWVTVSDELLEVIQFAEKLNQNSNGAFDIKIGRATKLWKRAFTSKTPVDQEKIDRQKKKKRRIRIRNNEVKTNRHTSLDFGGIAKGYAVDKAFEKLKQLLYDTILVDGGGDIRLGEAPKDVRGWKIAQYYDGGKILWLSNCAIATSGMDYQHIDIEETSQSHILNPATLTGITVNRGITVMANTCMEADALATAISVSGKYEALESDYDFQVNIKEDKEWIVKQF